jgi:hypothetical protein
MVWRYIVYISINYGVEIHRVHMHILCLLVNINKHGDDANYWRYVQ